MSFDRLEALRELVERWEQVTVHAKSGYGLTFDDYLNDMDLRRIIDERCREFVNAERLDIPESLSATLEVSDARFRAATFEIQSNIWGEVAERDEGWNAAREWYYYRLPNANSYWAAFLD